MAETTLPLRMPSPGSHGSTHQTRPRNKVQNLEKLDKRYIDEQLPRTSLWPRAVLSSDYSGCLCFLSFLVPFPSRTIELPPLHSLSPCNGSTRELSFLVSCHMTNTKIGINKAGLNIEFAGLPQLRRLAEGLAMIRSDLPSRSCHGERLRRLSKGRGRHCGVGGGVRLLDWRGIFLTGYGLIKGRRAEEIRSFTFSYAEQRVHRPVAVCRSVVGNCFKVDSLGELCTKSSWLMIVGFC